MNTKQTLGGWIAEQVIREQKEIKTIVAIYPGRFQPMGAHHAQAFKSIPFKDKFIATVVRATISDNSSVLKVKFGPIPPS